MEIVAKSKFIRISPRKLRLVASGIKNGSSAGKVLALLPGADKKAAGIIRQTLKQAISNATKNFSQREEDLKIKSIQIDGGSVFKRFRAVSRGMAHKIIKRTSHITIILEGNDKKQEEKK